MKAKCPYCKDGCERCDYGFNDIRFAAPGEGHYHAMICNQCGMHTGGWLHAPGRPMPEKTSPYAICPQCGKQDLRYETCEEALS